MSGNSVRLNAISAITSTPTIESGFDFASSPTSSIWGDNVFSLNEMEQRLPKSIFKSLKKTITSGEALDITTADAVAEAMKTWAISKGVTHYAHVFYPLTGLTAEKHDSFFDPDGNGGTMASFAGKALIQGEPDGSSFPNGGIRQTFEARGYTIWDVTSPAYIIENPNGTTLCIPTAFVSWTGEALDKKTPVLRSMQALNEHTQRVLKFFGNDGPFVSSTAGAEQEYFLVDNHFYHARPDLLSCGRTLFGAMPPKGQEFDDHYFGAIPERVQAFMFEVERECFKLGIPAKTRHNEVAPGQFEFAPVFEMANVATDHQQLVMTTIKKVATKYGMTALLHEKPFAGVNGSGKHVNFSMGSPKAGNLFDPGDTPAENTQFIVFCAAMISAVYKHATLLRSVVASASNDHRLGANEAPPAILSVFLGAELNEVMESIVNGSPVTSKKTPLNLGVDVLPQIPKDSGDRNRTSPMAFTGNRFEFRAVGSNQSIAGPMVAMNTIMAEALDEAAAMLEAADTSTPELLGKAVAAYAKKVWEECSSVVFNGDGYADEWQTEAAARGLPNLVTTPDALGVIKEPAYVELFGKYSVLSERELDSRYEVYAEQYIAAVNVESNLVVEIAKTMIFPAAVRYQGELASSLASLKAIGVDADHTTISKITDLIKSLQDSITELEALKASEHDAADVSAHCFMIKDDILPKMLEIRGYVDELETMVADDLWPLPTYQEMLFIK